MKFKLHDIRESKVWKEAHNEGKDENKRDIVPRLFATGMSLEKIAAVVKLSESEVSRIVNETVGPQKS